MTRLVSICVCLLIVGCAPSVTNIVAPSGKVGYSMNCGSKMGYCLEKAGELCPNGYNIINQASGTMAVPVYSSTGGVVASPRHEMAIECK